MRNIKSIVWARRDGSFIVLSVVEVVGCGGRRVERLRRDDGGAVKNRQHWRRRGIPGCRGCTL
ncbi:hypothetical protein KCP69_09350 [Salmonella enterica subsp. enterica]|nr:hypothetical protein KCP69_09350 [Salmonella enterica subsp. enterica]